MQKGLFLFLILAAASGWSQSPQSTVATTQTTVPFDGKWWSQTTADEHSGFINGAADCLTWVAHKKGFNATPEQLAGHIDRFYRTHPESANLSIVEVWKELWVKQLSRAAAAHPGETWKNAHWYLDGYWWLDDAPDQKQGFVEGYLWCMRTQVPAPAETYSKSAGFYVDNIDAFTKAHAGTEADREKVASIFARYKDKEPAVTSK